MDKANISNPKVNRGCAPRTANRTSADCVQISLGPSIPYIPLEVYHTGRFNAMIVYLTIYLGADEKKTSKLRVTGLCAGNSTMTSEFPAQRASNAEKCFHLITSSWSMVRSCQWLPDAMNKWMTALMSGLDHTTQQSAVRCTTMVPEKLPSELIKDCHKPICCNNIAPNTHVGWANNMSLNDLWLLA